MTGRSTMEAHQKVFVKTKTFFFLRVDVGCSKLRVSVRSGTAAGKDVEICGIMEVLALLLKKC